MKIAFNVWLKFRFRPLVRFTSAFTHSPVRVLTQSDELRVTIPSPQYDQREVRPDALMWIAGDGPAREDCERLARELGIEDRVRFLGQRRDLPELLAASDLVMIPSFCNDAFPYTAVEAMCAGRPVVASRDGGLDEMLAGGTRGLLVSPRDAEGFAEASLRLIHDPLFATGLAKEGSAFASELTVERHVGALTRIYEELLGSSS